MSQTKHVLVLPWILSDLHKPEPTCKVLQKQLTKTEVHFLKQCPNFFLGESGLYKQKNKHWSLKWSSSRTHSEQSDSFLWGVPLWKVTERGLFVRESGSVICQHGFEYSKWSCSEDKSAAVGFYSALPALISQHDEAVAAASVPARLWPESPRRRGRGHGKLQLEFVQKTASQWTDGSPRTGDASDPNGTLLCVYPEELCVLRCAAQTEDLPLLPLGVHRSRRSWMLFASSGSFRNNSQETHSSTGMTIGAGVNL